MIKKIPLDRLRDISKQRSIRKPIPFQDRLQEPELNAGNKEPGSDTGRRH